MMHPGSENSPSRDQVEMLAEEFLARYRQGEHPSVSEYIARYPDLAKEIQDLFPALVVLEDVRPARQEVLGSGTPEFSIPKRLGDYQIIREIGRGGMGVVYEAEQLSLGRRVAMKVMPHRTLGDLKHRRRFLREAKAAARLHHTNIVPVFGVGELEGVSFYVMQLIHGLGLDEVLLELKRMRKESAIGTQQNSAVERNEEKPRQLAAAGKELSAAVVAQSLISGQFEYPIAFESASKAISAKGPSTQPRIGSGRLESRSMVSSEMLHEATTGLLNDTHRGSGSFQFLGQSDNDSKGHSRSVYWKSVARIGVQVADALEHAHTQSIVHRDVKPGNLLLDTMGIVWVTDFGLAKSSDQQGLTQTGDILGTLRYMAPEQFEGRADARSDLYSLGLTLYELLALTPAYEERDRKRLVKRVTTKPPESLTVLDPTLPQDLVTIVHKVIDHDPIHRYQSARELAEDLERFLRDEPIKAKPISPIARFARWCKRNKALASLSFLIATLLIVVAVASVAAAMRFQRIADENMRLVRDRGAALADERLARRELMQQLFQSGLAEARANRWGGRIGQRLNAIEAIRRSAALLQDLDMEANAELALRNEAIAALASVDLKEVSTWSVPTDTESNADISPDLKTAAVDVRLGTSPFVSVYKLLDPSTELFRVPLTSSLQGSLCKFGPSGECIAAFTDLNREVRVMKLPAGTPILNVPATAFDFSRDGRVFATAHFDGTVSIYDLPSGAKVHEFKSDESPLESVKLSPDSRLVALARVRGDVIEIREVASGRVVERLQADKKSIGALNWSLNGSLVAGCWRDINIWSLSSPVSPPLIASGHESQVTDVQFVCDGRLVVSSGWDGTTRIWSSHSGEQLMQVPGKLVRLDETGKRLILRRGRELIAYSIIEPVACHRFYQNRIVDMALRNDARLIALAMRDAIRLWDIQEHRELARVPLENTLGVEFDADSGNLITSGMAGVHEWPVTATSDGSALTMGSPKPFNIALSDPGQIRMSDDGRILVVDHGSEGNRQWRATIIHRLESGLKTFALVRPFLRGVAVSPDGNWVATGNKWGEDVDVWNASDGQHVTRLTSHGSAYVAFSPDGRWIVTNSGDAVRFWEVGSWALRKSFPASTIAGSAISFSTDAGLAAVARNEQGVLLIDMRSLEPIATLETNARRSRMEQLLFTPDGSQLVAAAGELGIYVWNLQTIRRRLAAMDLDWDLPELPAVAPSGPLRMDIRLGVLDTPLIALLDRLEFGQAISKQDVALVDAALDDLSRVIENNPNDAEACVLRGRFQWALGRDRQALRDFTTAIDRDPENVSAYYQRARTRWWLHELAEAVRDYEEVLHRDPNHPRAEFEAAMCYVQCEPLMQNAKRALELAQKDLSLPANNSVDRHTQGIALYRLGRLNEAERVVNQAMQGGIRWLRPHLALAAIYHQQGKTKEAIEAFQVAQTLERTLGPSSQNALQNYHWRQEVAGLLGIQDAQGRKREDEIVSFDGEQLLVLARPTEGRLYLTRPNDTVTPYSLHWCPSHTGARLTWGFSDLPPGRYRLSGRFTKSSMGGQFRMSHGKRALGETFDGYASQTTSSGELNLGELDVGTGKNELTIEVTDSPPQSLGYHVQIDELKLTPLTPDSPIRKPKGSAERGHRGLGNQNDGRGRNELNSKQRMAVREISKTTGEHVPPSTTYRQDRMTR